MWDCSNCGTLAIADSVHTCPVCGADKSTGVEPSTTLTGPSPGWTPEPETEESPGQDSGKAAESGDDQPTRRTAHHGGRAARHREEDSGGKDEAPS